MSFCFSFLLSLLGVVSSQPHLLKWGRTGHALTAAVAQNLLSKRTKAAIKKLLPEVDGQLDQISSWADEIRDAEPWTFNLHFINTPAWDCSYEYSRDCHDGETGEPGRCVDGAIKNYTNRLANVDLPFDQQVEALKFVTHFIGDIHQPLHCGFIVDQGGNLINGSYDGVDTNLHAIWDEKLIETEANEYHGGDFDKYLAYLMDQLDTTWDKYQDSWLACPFDQQEYGECASYWAEGTVRAACEYAYVMPDGKTHIPNYFQLGAGYFKRNIPMVNELLARGGVRLAKVLNNIFD